MTYHVVHELTKRVTLIEEKYEQMTKAKEFRKVAQKFNQQPSNVQPPNSEGKLCAPINDSNGASLHSRSRRGGGKQKVVEVEVVGFGLHI
ncbi:hypothetical protein VNO77_45168 [Canavalia gladiata]|uniref:Uncharacterized protein n=1 Tax=Canavalia gladiata TaxID=3824 RepID=A0AAN9JRV1_CANGL